MPLCLVLIDKGVPTLNARAMVERLTATGLISMENCVDGFYQEISSLSVKWAIKNVPKSGFTKGKQ